MLRLNSRQNREGSLVTVRILAPSSTQVALPYHLDGNVADGKLSQNQWLSEETFPFSFPDNMIAIL